MQTHYPPPANRVVYFNPVVEQQPSYPPQAQTRMATVQQHGDHNPMSTSMGNVTFINHAPVGTPPPPVFIPTIAFDPRSAQTFAAHHQSILEQQTMFSSLQQTQMQLILARYDIQHYRNLAEHRQTTIEKLQNELATLQQQLDIVRSLLINHLRVQRGLPTENQPAENLNRHRAGAAVRPPTQET